MGDGPRTQERAGLLAHSAGTAVGLATPAKLAGQAAFSRDAPDQLLHGVGVLLAKINPRHAFKKIREVYRHCSFIRNRLIWFASPLQQFTYEI